MTPSPEPGERLPDLLDRLYHLHERAGDPHLELWPDGDAIGVLAYTRAHHNALPSHQMSAARREQILLRLRVTTVLQSLLDLEQLGALDQARPPGARRAEHLVPLADLAAVLGLTTPGAVSHRRDRIRAALHNQPRTPRHGRQILVERQARTRRRLAEVEQARRHHPQVQAAAQGLVDVRHELILTEEAQDWLHDLSLLLEEGTLRPDQMPSLAAYLSLFLAELAEDAAHSPQGADAVMRAHQALSYRDQ